MNPILHTEGITEKQIAGITVGIGVKITCLIDGDNADSGIGVFLMRNLTAVSY